MKLPASYDGPRLLRPDEARASQRLSRACFGMFGGPDPDADEPAAAPQPAAAEEAEAADDIHTGATHVVAHEGVPVSQISIYYTPLRVYESVVGVGSIGGVCTLPEQRGHGLATLLLDHCARQLVEMGSALMLISGGRGLYRRAGCEPTGLFASFTARGGGGTQGGSPDGTQGGGQNEAGTLVSESGLKLRPLTPLDAPVLARLYQAEPVHFMRSLDRFEDKLRHRSDAKAAEKWVLEQDGRAVGYLLLSRPWEHTGSPDAMIREVDEYAGSPTALADAACAAVERGGIRELYFRVPWQDAELVSALQQHLGQARREPLDSHTMRILDFPALMTGLHDYLRARLPGALLRGLTFEQQGGLIVPGMVFDQPLENGGPGRCAITRGADRLELSTADMTLLVMGDPENRLSLHPSGALRDVIEALFPLPSFLPGLDYH